MEMIHIHCEYFVEICKKGNLETVKYFYNIIRDDVNIETLATAFVVSCSHGHLEIVKWLFNLGKINIYDDDIGNHAFAASCEYDHLNVALWIYSHGNINIFEDEDGDNIFQECCTWGSFSATKWLYSLGFFDVHANDDFIFQKCSRDLQFDRLEWLLSIQRFDNNLINGFGKFYNKKIISILYSQDYSAENDILKNKFKLCMIDRIKYYKSLIWILGRLNVMYNHICHTRYKFNGVGFVEAEIDFNSLLRIENQLA